MRQYRTLSAFLLAMSLLAAGCSSNPGTTGSGSSESQAASAGDATGKTLRMYACEPQFLVPSNSNESCGSEILSQVYTPLIRVDKDLKAVFGEEHPDTVAASVEHNEDNTVWTIKLKDGWTFHNGEKVDAESFVRAWNYGANPKNAQNSANFYEHIKGFKDVESGAATELAGLKAVDPLTLEITLEAPFAPFVTMLGYTAFYPMPKAGLDDVAAYNEAPIGNGPFKFDGQWQHNQEINVVAYADYPGTKPPVEKITHQIYQDSNTAYNDLRAGNLDILEDLPAEQTASFKTDLGDKLYEGPTSNFGFLAYPVNDERFKDPKIRKALSMAIDREAIIQAVFDGARKPADDFVSPLVDGYRKGVCTACTHNPTEAKKLYDEAGGIDGTIEVWFNSGAGHEEWIEAVANNWKQTLGVQDVKFQSMIFAEYLNKLDEGSVTGPYRMAWTADYPSMENYLSALLSTGGTSNYGKYSNPAFDELIVKGNTAPTIEESIKFYQQADDILAEDMPIIPILYSKKFSGMSERVSDYSLDFNDHINILSLKVSE